MSWLQEVLSCSAAVPARTQSPSTGTIIPPLQLLEVVVLVWPGLTWGLLQSKKMSSSACSHTSAQEG